MIAKALRTVTTKEWLIQHDRVWYTGNIPQLLAETATIEGLKKGVEDGWASEPPMEYELVTIEMREVGVETA